MPIDMDARGVMLADFGKLLAQQGAYKGVGCGTKLKVCISFLNFSFGVPSACPPNIFEFARPGFFLFFNPRVLRECLQATKALQGKC